MKHDLPMGTTSGNKAPPPSAARNPGLIAWLQRRVADWLRRIDSRFGF